MLHAWYLSCDFHLYIIGAFMCLLINKRKKLGLAALAALTVVSIAGAFIKTLVFLEPPLLLIDSELFAGIRSHEVFNNSYIKSHMRSPPYFIGLFAGYFFYKVRNSKFHMGKVSTYLYQTKYYIIM